MTQTQPPATPEQPKPASNGVAKFTESTVDNVLLKVTSFQTNGDLKLPPNYSAENAVRSAWLMIQEVKNMDKRPALEVCTRESIANALLDMVLQGLNPVKKQCYFIVYGNKLVLQKSYIGTIMVSKRVADVKEVKGVPIYEGDVFKYEINLETGIKKIVEHTQNFANIDPDKVTGAYALVTKNDGTISVEVMTMKQIRKSWEMGNAKGASPAHKNFADEMSCKTVINRALKVAIGSSDDSSLYEEEELTETRFTADVKQEIKNFSNKDEIGFNDNTQEESNVTSELNGNAVQVNTETGEVKEEMKEEKPAVEGTQIKAPFL